MSYSARAYARNRYRVRAELRSQNPAATDSVLFLCCGVAGSVPEAELVARYGRDERGYAWPILLDCESRTTSENIRNALPLIEEFYTITIVSNSLHAEIGRAYLAKQRPDLATRLARAEEYRLGEIQLIKLLAAFVAPRRRRR